MKLTEKQRSALKAERDNLQSRLLDIALAFDLHNKALRDERRAMRKPTHIPSRDPRVALIRAYVAKAHPRCQVFNNRRSDHRSIKLWGAFDESQCAQIEADLRDVLEGEYAFDRAVAMGRGYNRDTTKCSFVIRLM